MRYTHISMLDNHPPLRACDAEQRVGAKPRGLWYGVDDDWRRWALSEGMQDFIDGRYLHRLVFGEERILRLSTPSDIDMLTDIWRPRGSGFGAIDWQNLAEIYDGIEIAPYCWERRMSDAEWYYTWDCASGCIWRPKGAYLDLVGSA